VGGEPRVIASGHSQAACCARSAAPPTAVDCEAEGEVGGAVRALATPPEEFALGLAVSSGDDRMLRVWDLKRRASVLTQPAESAVTSLDFDASSGESLKVNEALGLRLAAAFADGGWALYTVGVSRTNDKAAATVALTPALPRDAAPRHERRLTVCRFSPDGAWLALGCADATIYLHDVSPASASLGGEVARCFGHSSAITHLDWTVDSYVLRSNCNGHELRFFDVPSGQQIALASACRDLEWATHTAVLAWHALGIFARGRDGTGVQAAARSPSGSLLATVDDLSLVNLYRFPCPTPEKPGAPNRHAASGHSSPALACVWAEGASNSHETLLTAGGQDLCVLQWSLERRSHNRMMFGAATGV